MVYDGAGNLETETIGPDKYTEFDGPQGKPEHLFHQGDGSTGNPSYDATMVYDGAGNLETETIGPDKYTEFDGPQGKPEHLFHQGDGSKKNPSYDATMTYDGAGNLVTEQIGPDTYSEFDGPDGEPEHVFHQGDGSKKNPSYDATMTYDGAGNLVTEQIGPDTYSEFDGPDGEPEHVFHQGDGSAENPSYSADTYHNPDGTEEVDYSDGTTVIRDSEGTPIEEIIPDGNGGWADVVFAVELPLMNDVITRTKNNAQKITDALGRIKTTITTITDGWSGPAATQYANFTSKITTVSSDFATTFEDAVTRLQLAYDNYMSTEGTNTGNVKAPPHDQWHRPPPPDPDSSEEFRPS